jgi:hypothetical protein
VDAEDEVNLRYELEFRIQVLEPNKWWGGVNFEERGNGGVVLALTILYSRNGRLRIRCSFASKPHMHAHLRGLDSVRLHRDNARCVVVGGAVSFRRIFASLIQILIACAASKIQGRLTDGVFFKAGQGVCHLLVRGNSPALIGLLYFIVIEYTTLTAAPFSVSCGKIYSYNLKWGDWGDHYSKNTECMPKTKKVSPP